MFFFKMSLDSDEELIQRIAQLLQSLVQLKCDLV